MCQDDAFEHMNIAILDFDKFAEVARELKIPFIVDNTVGTPYLCNPFNNRLCWNSEFGHNHCVIVFEIIFSA